jgi:hypothetical protein
MFYKFKQGSFPVFVNLKQISFFTPSKILGHTIITFLNGTSIDVDGTADSHFVDIHSELNNDSDE